MPWARSAHLLHPEVCDVDECRLSSSALKIWDIGYEDIIILLQQSKNKCGIIPHLFSKTGTGILPVRKDIAGSKD